MIKKLLTGILIIFGVLFLLGFLADRYFFRNNEDYPAELINFQPKDLNINGGGPFFYRVDNKLFHTANGDLDFNSTPIWSGEFTNDLFFDCQVSPDNQYIALIRDKKEIIITTKDGKLLTKISPISKTSLDKDRHTGDFRGEYFQWSLNSKKLFLLNDKNWNGNKSTENESAIFEYSIPDNKLTELINLNEECKGSFFFDSTYVNLYYQVAIGGEFYIKMIRLDNPSESKVYEKSEIQIAEIQDEPVFINYYRDQFGNWNSKGSSLFVEKSEAFYFYSDSLTELVFKTKRGHDAFKGGTYGFRNGNSGFLPNNKFYYTGNWAKDNEGTIFINAENLSYTFRKLDFECFYSMTNGSYPDFVLRYEIEPNLEFETSYQ